ncbi:MAG: hypothetical protein R6W84_04120, partial [Promethearchaeia archaeon]
MNKEMSEKWKDKRIEINNNTWVVFDEDYVDFSQEGGKLDFVSLSKKEFENIIKEYNSYQEKNTRKKGG